MMQMWEPVNHAYPHKRWFMHQGLGECAFEWDKRGSIHGESEAQAQAASDCGQGG
jgi:hypothetical protein